MAILVHAATADEERRERIYELAWAGYADPEPAMRAASEIRDRHFGPRVTYSRKVFIPSRSSAATTAATAPSSTAPAPARGRT
jgi:hypothetical protein